MKEKEFGVKQGIYISILFLIVIIACLYFGVIKNIM